jgi:hypothetical protein
MRATAGKAAEDRSPGHWENLTPSRRLPRAQAVQRGVVEVDLVEPAGLEQPVHRRALDLAAGGLLDPPGRSSATQATGTPNSRVTVRRMPAARAGPSMDVLIAGTSSESHTWNLT